MEKKERAKKEKKKEKKEKKKRKKEKKKKRKKKKKTPYSQNYELSKVEADLPQEEFYSSQCSKKVEEEEDHHSHEYEKVGEEALLVQIDSASLAHPYHHPDLPPSPPSHSDLLDCTSFEGAFVAHVGLENGCCGHMGSWDPSYLSLFSLKEKRLE